MYHEKQVLHQALTGAIGRLTEDWLGLDSMAAALCRTPQDFINISETTLRCQTAIENQDFVIYLSPGTHIDILINNRELTDQPAKADNIAPEP